METTIKKIEDMSLNAWPSHKMELYDGWILRFSYFYTHRTNSVEQFGTSTLPWREKIFDLKRTTNPIHRSVVPSMYRAILKETVCASITKNGEIIATGLGILDRDYIGIYAIHVREDYRRRGYARQICTGLLNEGKKRGASHAYLQVVKNNTSAEKLYSSLGFQYFYTYWFRVQPVGTRFQ